MEVKNSASVCQIKKTQVKNTNCSQGFIFQVTQTCTKLKGGVKINLLVSKEPPRALFCIFSHFTLMKIT